jgi:hypothetical protein
LWLSLSMVPFCCSFVLVPLSGVHISRTCACAHPTSIPFCHSASLHFFFFFL